VIRSSLRFSGASFSKKTNTHLTLTAAYYSQTDDQNERTNQIMEIIFKSFFLKNIKKLSE
jgi:hypothetical protein